MKKGKQKIESNQIADAIEGLKEKKFDEVLDRYFMYFKTSMYIGVIFFIIAAAGAQMGVLPLAKTDLAVILFALFLGVVMFTLVDIVRLVVETKNKVTYKPLRFKK